MQTKYAIPTTFIGLATVCAACNVESLGQDTGGIELPGDDAGKEGAAPTEPDAGNEPPPPPRRRDARGYLVVNRDRESASVSVLDLQGTVLSESLISSSSEQPGLSLPLSRDVVPPSMALPGTEIVLIDRSDTSVLTWVDLETADVRAQLSVATGFASNPHDYVPYSKTKAFVTRYAPNLDSGQEDYDEGDDVLIIDPSKPEITGRIDLTSVLEGEREGFYPRADRALMAGGLLRVLAITFDLNYTDRLDSRLVTIDPESEEITDVLVFERMNSCRQAALSPDGTRLAIACNGAFGTDPAEGFADSGILVVSASKTPSVLARMTAKQLGTEQISQLDWAGPSQVLALTYGRYNDDRSAPVANDTLISVDIGDGTVSAPILESKTTPFTLRDVRCEAKGKTCLVSDGVTEGGVVHLLAIEDDGGVTVTETVNVDSRLGLPPYWIGAY